MSSINYYSAFEGDDDNVPIHTETSNPIRKLKKQLRKAETRYEKNPSPEISNLINYLIKNIYELENPFVKRNVPKFKKKKLNKAEASRIKKKNKDEKIKQEYERKIYEEREKMKQEYERKIYEEREKMLEEQQSEKIKQHMKKFENYIPKDIKKFCFKYDPKQYHTLARKYHPDKGGDEELFKLISNVHETLQN
ncbi:MAG: hypothetical protein CXT73_05085 [Methanobacteriota archaeon]|nr:MAG: hypothetical protein CXT73_05085 [Euryarchaeota archaeon]